MDIQTATNCSSNMKNWSTVNLIHVLSVHGIVITVEPPTRLINGVQLTENAGVRVDMIRDL